MFIKYVEDSKHVLERNYLNMFLMENRMLCNAPSIWNSQDHKCKSIL